MLFAKKFAFGLALILGLAGGVRADEPAFEEPADGVYTELQLTNYLDCTREFVKLQEAAGQAAQNASGLGAMAIAGRSNQKFQAILASHNTTLDEWLWVGGKTWEAYMVIVWEQTESKMKAELEQGVKKNDEQLAAAKAKLAAHEEAQKKGLRVLSDDDRQRAIDNAKEQIAGLNEQLEQARTALQETTTQIAEHQAAAQKAEEQAKNPPADLTDPDERESFINDRKADADNARQAIADGQERQKEQQASVDDLNAQLAAAQQRADHPEIPQTDQEKEQVKQENDSAIASTRQQIEQLQESGKLLAETLDQSLKQYEESRPQSPAPNVQLLRDHLAEFAQIWKIELPKE
ncbi:MAG: hypothetical protein IT446_13015 [Phycisphaerales bacterium]|nr:hypothetical protein [Phycisphaerales bacterium]